VLVAADSSEEAHYLCALLNSSLSTFLAQSSSVDGGKGFGTPGMLNHLNLRRFQPGNSCHLAIAECSVRAHRAAAAGDDLREIEDDLDRLTSQLAGLDQRQLSLIHASLSVRHP
jgi:hypothetical protein